MRWEELLSRRTAPPPRVRASGTRPKPPEGAVDFSSQQPSPDLVPRAEILACLEHVLTEHGSTCLAYAPDAGVGRLRAAIARDLVARGVPVEPDDVVVTSGSQQGIDFLARALVDPGDAFLVEAATYPGTIRLLTAAGARIVTIPCDAEGPIPARLREAAGLRPKGLYLMPGFHNPTGASISAARREEIVRWSREAGVPLVEDDYDADLVLDGPPLPARLRTLDPDVCHIGTYSKKLIPALRIGYLLCPEPLRARVVTIKIDQDGGGSALLQHALAEFLDRGLLAAHLARTLPEYRARRDVLERVLRAEAPSLSWKHPGRGLFLWIPLPAGVSPDAVVDEGRRRGVLVQPGTIFDATDQGLGGIRVAFCREPRERIEEGARRLGAALRAVGAA